MSSRNACSSPARARVRRARGHGRIVSAAGLVSRGIGEQDTAGRSKFIGQFAHTAGSQPTRPEPTVRRTRCARAPVWVLIVASVASLMVALDALVVTTALPTIRVDLGASIEQLEWTVNAYTLSFAVLLMTGAALGDRFGRRRMFAAGLAVVLARVGRMRARAECRPADRRACRPGRRRGARDAAWADAADRGVPGGAAGARARDLQRHHRTRGARRSGRRWRDHAGNRLAVDLLDQRPDRTVDDSRRAPARRGELRPAQRPRHRRPGAGHRRRARARVGARAR